MGNEAYIWFILAVLITVLAFAIPLWIYNIFEVYDRQETTQYSFWTILFNSLFGIDTMNRTQVYHSFSIEMSPPTANFPKGQPYIQWFYEDGTESKRSPYMSTVESARAMAVRHARMKRGLPASPVGPNDINKSTSRALVPVSSPYTTPAYNYPRYNTETFDEKWAKGVRKFLPDYAEETQKTD